MSSLRLTLQDRHGLVFGYRLTQPPHALTESHLGELSGTDAVWLHFNLTDARARHWLSHDSGLSEAALSVLMDPQPRVRIVPLADAVVAILEDLHHDFQGDPEAFGELRFYIDEHRIISARRHPLKTVDLLRRGIDAGEGAPSPAAWVERLAGGLVHTFGELINDLVEQVDRIEDEIVAGRGQTLRGELADIRRLIVRLRRHLNADRAALLKLNPLLPGPALDHPQGLKRCIERLDGVAQDLDLVHERVRLLQDEVAGVLAEATNRNLYVLSIMTTVLLPTTLITGLWGMNVPGLPWANDPLGFLWVGTVVLGSVIVSLLLLRGSRVV